MRLVGASDEFCDISLTDPLPLHIASACRHIQHLRIPSHTHSQGFSLQCIVCSRHHMARVQVSAGLASTVRTLNSPLDPMSPRHTVLPRCACAQCSTTFANLRHSILAMAVGRICILTAHTLCSTVAVKMRVMARMRMVMTPIPTRIGPKSASHNCTTSFTQARSSGACGTKADDDVM